MPAGRPVAACLVFGVVAVSALPAPAAVDPARVREAVSRGADFLRKFGGVSAAADGHAIGRAALAGIAMLEGGVPPSDPAVVAAARTVRGSAATETKTYDIALAILFLDRLGESTDIPVVQMLGVRLYGGMMASGGWTYDCGNALPQAANGFEQNQLVGQPVPAQPEPKKPKNDSGFPEVTKKTAPTTPAEPEVGRLNDAVARYYLSTRQALRTGGRQPGEGDNSNTQFGLVGLWVASRHGVPADDAFALIDARFLTSQNRADAGWSYSAGSPSSGAMTCAGLLGLAVGGGRNRTPPPPSTARATDPKNANDPFFNPPKKEAEQPSPNAGLPGLVGPPAKRVAIANALASLGVMLARARQGGPVDYGAGNQYYLLWSLERVGVAYGLTTIGNVDWYDWGASILLAPGAQTPDGAWGTNGGSGYGPDVDTSFAILFLAKSNFTRDLSRQLTGQVNDPGTTELRGGGDIPLFGASTGAKPKAAATTAAVVPPATSDAPSDKITEALLTAGAEWAQRLEMARDTKGADYTAGLVKAIPLLSDDKQKQARDALAERLTRMTAASLRTMMADADPELRRGAVLAAAMKDDKSHIADLIDRVSDPADTVVRAARAGLRSLTGQDFGPASGASAAAKAKAAADWKRWHASRE